MAHSVSSRAFTATVVGVTPHDRLDETYRALRALQSRAAIRTILVTLGDARQPILRDDADMTIVDGILPQFLNNVVASLRLSSMPALAWWRGGDASALPDLATLVDRLVFDSTDPAADWKMALTLVDRTAIGDLRWTRLTRWRALLAQTFDAPDVRAGLEDFTRLEVEARDEHAAKLLAGWLTDRLPAGGALDVTHTASSAGEGVSAVTLSGSGRRVELRLLPNQTCIETTIGSAGSRIVSLGDQQLPALLAEELRVRARDAAFEAAVRKVMA